MKYALIKTRCENHYPPTPTYALLIGVTQVAGYHFINQRVDLSLSPPLISLQDLQLHLPSSCQLNRTQCFCTGSAKKMRIRLVLVTLFLVMKLRYTQSRCEEPGSRRPLSDPSLVNERNIARRFSDLDYDSFVGLMGRRSTEAANDIPSANKREMHDIFVGLMGRRNAEKDNGAWRRTSPERRGVYLNKCGLRFRRGL